MPPKPAAFLTDQQRFARAGRMGPPLPPPVVSDKTRFNQVCRKTLALALRPVVPPALVVAENTFVIRGKDGTYLGFAFGDGRQVSQLNLYDHLPADRVPHLGNYILSLTGLLPDAIGIDIGASVGSDVRGSFGSSGLSAQGGVNILWHTRGEGDRKWYPEVHVYYGYSGSFSFGTVFSGLSSALAPNASAAVQIILAWARKYDDHGVGRPAENAWIANGYNWTGTFWSAGVSVPVPPRFNLVGSYFQSVPFGSGPKKHLGVERS